MLKVYSEYVGRGEVLLFTATAEKKVKGLFSCSTFPFADGSQIFIKILPAASRGTPLSRITWLRVAGTSTPTVTRSRPNPSPWRLRLSLRTRTWIRCPQVRSRTKFSAYCDGYFLSSQPSVD